MIMVFILYLPQMFNSKRLGHVSVSHSTILALTGLGDQNLILLKQGHTNLFLIIDDLSISSILIRGDSYSTNRPQHFLYFFPLPQGQGWFLPILDGFP